MIDIKDDAETSEKLTQFVDYEYVRARSTTDSSDLQVCHAYIAYASKTLCDEASPADAIGVLQGYIDGIKSGALIART